MTRDRQRTFYHTRLAILFFVGLAHQVMAEPDSATREKILAGFYPYRQTTPQVAGITAGMTINKTNAQVATSVLPPEVLKVVQDGDLDITVQATTDLSVREEYIQATLAHVGQAALGPDGILQNYVAGLPFPLIEPADTQAGVKLGWNLRYRDQADITQSWGTMALLGNQGSVLLSSSSLYVRMYGMHRSSPERNIGEWAERGILYKDYSMTFQPPDAEGTQTMGIRHNLDTLSDDRWLYDPKTRRTRKLIYTPYDAFQGLTFLSEEFSGFEGHVSAHEWQFIEDKLMLVPGVLKGETAHLGGSCKCYPVDPWELRWMRVVDVVPREANHPYGRRRLYIDLQHGSPLLSVIFDKEGRHWRTFFFTFGDPESSTFNKGVRIPVFVGNSWVDYKAERATTWLPSKNIYNRPVPPHFFTVASMMRQGK